MPIPPTSEADAVIYVYDNIGLFATLWVANLAFLLNQADAVVYIYDNVT